MDDNKIIGKVSLMVVLILQALSASFIAARRPLINNTAVQSMAGGRSLVFELAEHYHLSLPIGDPPKSFTFDVDTGSVLIWVQCGEQCEGCNLAADDRYKPEEDNRVPHKDPLCSKILRSKDQNMCDFHISYEEGLMSSGYLVKDRFTWAAESPTSPINLAFGCADCIKIPGDETLDTAGILGLGQDVVSFPSQLKAAGVVTHNVIGHCLKREGGGFLFIGDDHVPASGVTWTPFASRVFYSSGSVDLFFDGKAIPTESVNKVVFDSGTTYTYFPSEAYEAILKEVKDNLNNEQFIEAPEDGRFCWKLARKERTIDFIRNFKTIALRFENQAELLLPPKNYLEVTEPGVVCLAILEGKDKRKGGILGKIAMLYKTVIYDNEKRRIGWKYGNCVTRTSRTESFLTDTL